MTVVTMSSVLTVTMLIDQHTVAGCQVLPKCLLQAELCPLPQIHMFKSQPPAARKGTLCGNRIGAHVIS